MTPKFWSVAVAFALVTLSGYISGEQKPEELDAKARDDPSQRATDGAKIDDLENRLNGNVVFEHGGHALIAAPDDGSANDDAAVAWEVDAEGSVISTGTFGNTCIDVHLCVTSYVGLQGCWLLTCTFTVLNSAWSDNDWTGLAYGQYKDPAGSGGRRSCSWDEYSGACAPQFWTTASTDLGCMEAYVVAYANIGYLVPTPLAERSTQCR